MDETTKILIGTISGFIIAFFAEPVKSYFQTAHKIKNLQRMLYQETMENYTFLQSIFSNETSFENHQMLAKALLKTSGYEYAIANEITVYYQLKEVTLFNKLYSLLEQIFEHEPPLEFRKEIPEIYKELISKAIKSKEMDIYLLRKLRSKKELEEILKT